MNRRERTLLAQIEQDVLDDTKPLAGALRKCVVLGGHAGSAVLRDWAQRELRGYDGVDLADIPSYRVVVAPLKVDAAVINGFVTGQQISPGQLPDIARDVISNELALRMGIGELEGALAQQHDHDDGQEQRDGDRDDHGVIGSAGQSKYSIRSSTPGSLLRNSRIKKGRLVGTR